MPDDQGIKTLEYGRAPTIGHKWLARMLVILPVFLIVLAIWLFREQIFKQYYRLQYVKQIYRTQQECMAALLPADHVSYSDVQSTFLRPDRIDVQLQQLSPSNPYASEVSTTAYDSQDPFADFLYSWTRAAASGVAPRPPPIQVSTVGMHLRRPTRYPIFMHERKSPGGGSRLVYVTASPASLETSVVVPGNRLSLPGPTATIQDILIDRVKWSNSMVLYAGQPDPADATRFTIAFKIGDRSGEFEGKLGDDNRIDFHAPGSIDMTPPGGKGAYVWHPLADQAH